MTRIVKVAGWPGTPRASVLFLHGLGGHAYDTWRRAPDDDTFWPLWLARDVAGLAVYTVAYAAPPSNWLGTAMPLQDRAVNILECLLAEPGLRAGPVAFIGHSLGGLLVKQMMLDMQRQMARRPEAAALFGRVTQVVFVATPHTGSRQGTWLDRLRFLAWPSSLASMLVANDPTLRNINVAYRGLADDRRDVLRHRVFTETQGTHAGVIVDAASADPGLPGDPPVPIMSASPSRSTGYRSCMHGFGTSSRRTRFLRGTQAAWRPARCRRSGPSGRRTSYRSCSG